MSRAIRRQQQQAGAQKDSAPASPRSLGIRRPRSARGARPPAQQQGRRRLRLRSPAWVDDIWSELKKVTWPSRDETIYLTTVVIIVAVTVGVILGSIDLFFNWLIDRLLLR
ncbi:MAG TPA: preprotein translocase subunit SecE [Dehalococcoidia bacterium]|nr:preprotein translocase subunit SecE [Dehalococcoidia bacterium]